MSSLNIKPSSSLSYSHSNAGTDSDSDSDSENVGSKSEFKATERTSRRRNHIYNKVSSNFDMYSDTFHQVFLSNKVQNNKVDVSKCRKLVLDCYEIDILNKLGLYNCAWLQSYQDFIVRNTMCSDTNSNACLLMYSDSSFQQIISLKQILGFQCIKKEKQFQYPFTPNGSSRSRGSITQGDKISSDDISDVASDAKSALVNSDMETNSNLSKEDVKNNFHLESCSVKTQSDLISDFDSVLDLDPLGIAKNEDKTVSSTQTLSTSDVCANHTISECTPSCRCHCLDFSGNRLRYVDLSPSYPSPGSLAPVPCPWYECITCLNLSNNLLLSINGIELMTQLTVVDISDNLLSSYAPLLSCKLLKVINCQNNKIQCIESVSVGHAHIEYLDVSHNRLVSIENLETYVHLKHLKCNNCHLDSISPLICRSHASSGAGTNPNVNETSNEDMDTKNQMSLISIHMDNNALNEEALGDALQICANMANTLVDISYVNNPMTKLKTYTVSIIDTCTTNESALDSISETGSVEGVGVRNAGSGSGSDTNNNTLTNTSSVSSLSHNPRSTHKLKFVDYKAVTPELVHYLKNLKAEVKKEQLVKKVSAYYYGEIQMISNVSSTLFDRQKDEQSKIEYVVKKRTEDLEQQLRQFIDYIKEETVGLINNGSLSCDVIDKLEKEHLENIKSR